LPTSSEIQRWHGGELSLPKFARGSARRAAVFFSGFRRKLYGPITHVRTNAKAAALTFDDGPHPEYTIALLQVLEKHGAKATFFMVGQIAERFPDLVRKVAEHGHAVANHSMTHRPFPELGRQARLQEIVACEKALKPHAVKLFRPPFGLENAFTHRDAKRLGYDVIKWSISVDDWRDHRPEWIAERVMRPLQAGSIILMHDNRIEDPEGSQRQTIDALDRILATAAGSFKFCTVPELMKLGTPMSSFQPIW
jgi:peptidoglycan/xylan/chitin deacetylase (PgdA/CDA1 family)